jgi:hypothetical protein
VQLGLLGSSAFPKKFPGESGLYTHVVGTPLQVCSRQDLHTQTVHNEAATEGSYEFAT